MFEKLKKILFNPRFILLILLHKFSRLITNDELYIRIEYFLYMGRRLNLNPPTTFNEKLQWLKLHDRNPTYTQMVDKYEVKKNISNILGEEYVIPTLGVWDSFDDVNFEELPDQFVLKCTHDSGGIVICKDKSSFDINKAKKTLNKFLRRQYYYEHREYPYKNIKPRIIAEKYMVDESGTELKDYKFFCFCGKPKMLFILTDRFIDTRLDFFDDKFEHLPFERGYPNAEKEIRKPENFEQMLDIAAKLSQNIDFVRIDLYNINGKIYFGEFTFTPGNGMEPFTPEDWDRKVGEWLTFNNKLFSHTN